MTKIINMSKDYLAELVENFQMKEKVIILRHCMCKNTFIFILLVEINIEIISRIKSSKSYLFPCYFIASQFVSKVHNLHKYLILRKYMYKK